MDADDPPIGTSFAEAAITILEGSWRPLNEPGHGIVHASFLPLTQLQTVVDAVAEYREELNPHQVRVSPFISLTRRRWGRCSFDKGVGGSANSQAATSSRSQDLEFFRRREIPRIRFSSSRSSSWSEVAR